MEFGAFGSLPDASCIERTGRNAAVRTNGAAAEVRYSCIPASQFEEPDP